MADLVESLNDLATRFDAVAARIDTPEFHQSLKSIGEGIIVAAEAFCGSWIGYHSRVYYKELQRVPAGAHFSAEWGLYNRMSLQSTTGEWVEYTANDVYEFLKQHAEGMDFDQLVSVVDSVGTELHELREEALSYLTALNDASEDSYIAKLLEQATKRLPRGIDDFIRASTPHIHLVCRDSVAMSAGMQVPPHINLNAQVNAIEDRLTFAKDLAALCRRAASHVSRRRSANREARKPGTKVFIGHGRSKLWKDLKDFIRDRLNLDYDEFNRVPVAGTTNIARLETMLDDAAIAFLVLTAEDETVDGETRARENVVHEAGLFQGRLGFMKAIVLLEQGCNEFSNIHGLGQIRFPKGNIGAAFEEIRLVLEREGTLGES